MAHYLTFDVRRLAEQLAYFRAETWLASVLIPELALICVIPFSVLFMPSLEGVAIGDVTLKPFKRRQRVRVDIALYALGESVTSLSKPNLNSHFCILCRSSQKLSSDLV